MDTNDHEYEIIQADCIQCAACTSFAPDNFEMGEDTAFIVKQPTTKMEEELCEAASINCPTSAIRLIRGRGTK